MCTLKELDNKIEQLINDIKILKENQNQIKELEQLGYSIVIYDKQKIEIINYSKEKKKNTMDVHSWNLINNKLDFENYIKPIDIDIEKIEYILFKKYQSISLS